MSVDQQIEDILSSLTTGEVLDELKKLDTLCGFNSTDLEIKLGMFMILMMLTNNTYFTRDNQQLKDIFSQFVLQEGASMRGGARGVSIQTLITIAVFCLCIHVTKIELMRSPQGENIRSVVIPGGACFNEGKAYISGASITIATAGKNMLAFAAWVTGKKMSDIPGADRVDQLLTLLKEYTDMSWSEWAWTGTTAGLRHALFRLGGSTKTCETRIVELTAFAKTTVNLRLGWGIMMQGLVPVKTSRVERVKMMITGGPIFTVAYLAGKIAALSLHAVQSCASAVSSLGATAPVVPVAPVAPVVPVAPAVSSFGANAVVQQNVQYYTPKTLTRNGGRRNKRKTKMNKKK